MRAKLTFLSALVLGTFGGVLATGCQTYDFEPVDPLAISQTTETRYIEARAAKPNLMLLVDKSGSMKDPVDPSDSDCMVAGELCGQTRPCNTATCPTRWSELQAAMRDFLDSSGTLARFGLATYPADASCGSTSTISVDLPADGVEDEASLGNKAEEVKAEIFKIKNSSSTGEPTPAGGTPTGQSLKFMGGLSELQTADRDDFVLLLTDGLPNCNSAHPTPYPQCFCTLQSCEAASAKQIGCLDDDASVAAVKELGSKGIQTIVIGFGADFESSSTSGQKGAETLNAMAVAGGFKRKCAQNSDCGTGDGDTCENGLCKRQFFQAANRADLVAALRDISGKILVKDPCLLTFDASERPTSQELVVVYVNKERLASGADTWSLTEEGISFAGATCERIKNSTPSSPVDIEVRAVQRR
ncbi:adventurous gliding motility lipoprotein CglB [Archangium violaceum]|uniref:adventurous gliding motility lipoprotein CglB n=1 Tax=Archangium violaceum TaxID=83451 RepID=UPI00193BF889|nr:adventurous gliding motility lipoprotein CglB [Archangium violaceum]QRK07577.1 adventurous gliding motility lipoprotein CglB [Archangium violaceum]